ncbi:MAG TPA: response regulator transcription factor [Aggregatilineales bacterium]|nr:response regulator transcription factor [Aggregatilineales bacterium]
MSETTETPEIKILIVDDHGMVRFGLRGYLQTTPGLTVVGEAACAEDALNLLDTQPIDVVLMDLALPKMSGADAIRLIVQRHPEVRVLVLTSFLDDAHTLPAIRAGATGYVLKDIDPDDLVKAVQATYHRQSILHPQVMNFLAEHVTPSSDAPNDPFVELTERETEVLLLLARGLTNHAIASQLMVSENTVRTHVSNMLAKLNVRDRTQAALLALQHHLIPLSEVQPYFCDE